MVAPLTVELADHLQMLILALVDMTAAAHLTLPAEA
jgi:hypothetical protein